MSDERLGEPRTNHELFEPMVKAEWLDAPLGTVMRKMVGFRNLVVHGYLSVDLNVLRDIVENRLGDLLAFAAAMRDRLPENG